MVNMPGPDVPLRIEIVGLLPTLFGHCAHCDFVAQRMKVGLKKDQIDEYPPSLVKENHRVSEIVWDILEDFPGKARVEIINTASPAGIWKSLKHRLRSNTAFIVNGRKIEERIPDYANLKPILEQELERQTKAIAGTAYTSTPD